MSPDSKRHKGDSIRTRQLETGDSIVIIGRGWLRVLQGTVQVHGYSLHGPHGKVYLSCDAYFPICVYSLGQEDNIPYASAGFATLSLTKDVDDDDESLQVVDIHTAFHPQEWKDASYGIASSISDAMASGAVGSPPVIWVCGGKNTGKSSFCRYLVNMLLKDHSSVEYLDMDCGQTEFSAPGLVSLCEIREPLLGPPYYERRVTPKLGYFVGDTSPSSDPDAYVGYILSLYRSRSMAKPLVVNTYGWIQGLGLDVLDACFRGMDVTHAVRIQSDKERNNVSEGFFSGKEGARFEPIQYTIPALSSEAPSTVAARRTHQDILATVGISGRNTSAVERRNMQWNRFAMQCCGLSGMDCPIDIGTRLASHPPYVVSLDTVHVSCTQGVVPDDQIMRVLNGSVVGLCTNTSKKCMGLGIVRSVNVATRMLYIVTPVVQLDAVNHLMLGKLDLPPHLVQTDQFKSPYLALHAMTAEGTAAGAGKSRNNLLRASQK